MALTKAIIEVIEKDKGQVDESTGLKKSFEVQFNPSEYILAKSVQIAEIAIPGIDSPLLQFVRGQTEKLTLELFFDTTERGMDENATDVTKQTKAVYQLVKIMPETHAPPRVRFTWGEGLSFQGVVESVQQRFTLFNPRGVPLRATLSVTFREYKTLEEQLKELNLKSADQTKLRVVRRGDTLSGIAWEEYGDARKWRLIADENHSRIANPRRLEPGTALQIPPSDSFRATGRTL